MTCWCCPRVEWIDKDTGMPWASGDGPLVVHFAEDCRETSEQVTGEAMEPDKTWQMVET